VPLLEESKVSTATREFEFEWRADGKLHWIRLTVRHGNSRLALVGKPHLYERASSALAGASRPETLVLGYWRAR
jgi:hypothetical protein